MDLLSSSDEDERVSIERPPLSRPSRAPSPSVAPPAAAARDEDLLSVLLPDESTPPVDMEADRRRSTAATDAKRYTGSYGSGLRAWRRHDTKAKPVISARELLRKLIPRAAATDTFVSPPKPRLVPAAPTASSPVPRIAGHREKQQEAPALTPSQRIALEYGLKPSGEAASSTRADQESSPPSRYQPETTVVPVVDRKKAFWKEHVAKATPSKRTYVSPFSSPDAFEDVRRRRRRTSAPLDPHFHQSATDEGASRRRSVDALGISDDDDSDAAPGRSRTGGEATKASVNDADDDLWFSDASDGASNADKPSRASHDNVAGTADNEPTSTASAQTASGSRPRTRVQPKRRRRTEVLEHDATDSYEEHWPKLPPSTNDEGPMVLPPAEDSDAEQLSVCANINNYLFDYQREGVQFLSRAYLASTGAILGDEMGLGKTIQVIALLAAILQKTGRSEDKQTWKALRSARRERYAELEGDAGRGDLLCGGAAPILIVVPASLLHNWEAELHVWLSCSTVIVHGNSSERESLLDQIERGEYEIVICSYDILKICNERMHAIPWEVVIFDEMHCLKNPESQLTKAVKAIKCRKRLGLTGTLMQNNEKELHCLVDTIAPGVLGSWQEFRIFYGDDIKYGRKKSAVPEALERSRVKEKKLRHKLVPYYLRREKEINPQFQVVKKCDQVVFCDLTPLQMAAYKRILAMPEFELLRRGEEPCDCSRDSKRKRKECCYHTPMDMGIPASEAVIWSRFHVGGQACRSCPNCMGLVCVAQLLKLSNHMELLKVNPRDPPEIQEYATRFATQAFGGDLEVVGGVQQVTTFQETRALGTSTCGKMLVLEKLLALWQKRRQKTLLFSRSTRMLDILQLFLISKAIAYSRLDGNTKVEERQGLVNAFNRSDSNVSVFLISTRAGGVGLNLPSATNVVIFDPSWNPAHDCQAQDRAYRIGQTKNVQVYRLITLGTIEEMIYVRQIYKQQLSDTTLKGVKAPRYFEGVQGDRHQQGELFGIRNLLCWKEGSVLKGIQDAYKRDSDGFVLQTNQFQYEKLGVKKRAKKKAAKVVEDAEEMVDVADELVADMLSPASSANADAAAPSSSNVEVDGDQAESDEEEFLLPGATTAMHEAIVGEQSNGTDSPLSDSDDSVATEDQAEPENEERTAMELPSASSAPTRGAVTVNTSDEEAVTVIAVRPAPHPALARKRSTATASAVGAGGSPRPRKGLYVPRYL